MEELSLRGMAHLLSAKPLVATAFFLSEVDPRDRRDVAGHARLN